MNMKRIPGTFVCDGREYVARSNITHLIGIPAHVITDAISNGTLPVHLVSGCKCVAVADLAQIQGGAK